LPKKFTPQAPIARDYWRISFAILDFDYQHTLRDSTSAARHGADDSQGGAGENGMAICRARRTFQAPD